jgi:hypothetical protein
MLDALAQIGINKTKGIPLGAFKIYKIQIGYSFAKHNDPPAVYNTMRTCLITLDSGCGFSYFHGDLDETVKKYVDKDVRDIALDRMAPLYIRVAAIDALHSLISRRKEKDRAFLRGNRNEKGAQRAKEVFREVQPGDHVALLGAVPDFVILAKKKKFRISVYDMAESKIGTDCMGVQIQKGGNLEEILSTNPRVTHVCATGMIFATGTAGEVFEVCRKYKKRLILFMETGANFGEELIQLGAQHVLAEFFPFFDFAGETRYSVYTAAYERSGSKKKSFKRKSHTGKDL